MAYLFGSRMPFPGPRAAATEAVGRAADPRITARLPDRGAGFCAWPNRRYPPGEFRYGRPETVRALRRIGKMWQVLAGGAPPIGIGDISRRGGEGGHPIVVDGKVRIGHRSGLEVDILPVRGDGRPGKVDRREPEYSRRLTQRLVDVIRRNGVLEVRHVLFNDPGIRGARAYPYHDDHLHVHFEPRRANSEEK